MRSGKVGGIPMLSASAAWVLAMNPLASCTSNAARARSWTASSSSGRVARPWSSRARTASATALACSRVTCAAVRRARLASKAKKFRETAKVMSWCRRLKAKLNWTTCQPACSTSASRRPKSKRSQERRSSGAAETPVTGTAPAASSVRREPPAAASAASVGNQAASACPSRAAAARASSQLLRVSGLSR